MKLNLLTNAPMQSLDDIGFYTLSDARARNASSVSPLSRCELVLTEVCNFKCTYCKGITNPEAKGTINLEVAKATINYWISEGLKNVRFTGGEPTLYRGLIELVQMCKDGGVEKIAISTNGSNSQRKYQELIDAGVNDMSISLDACCASIGNEMAGVANQWETVIENIKWLSKKIYVTIGMVFTEQNINNCVENVLFADSLGAADIRVIPSAQFNKALIKLKSLPQGILDKYPILNYRIRHLNSGRLFRGLSAHDTNKCWLALDDMACAQGKHFPCIIYLREGGKPIGSVNENTRQDRERWIHEHDSFNDNICKKNCLDVCIDYNNRAALTR